MSKKLIVLIVFIAFLLGLMIYAGASKPKTIDWTPTYATQDKKPLGLYVFNREAENLFKGHNIIKFTETAYQYLDSTYDYENEEYQRGSIITISQENDVDEESAKELINFVSQGNTVLMSMDELPEVITDTLKLKIGLMKHYPDSLKFEVLGYPKKFWFKEGIGMKFFDSLKSNDTLKVLGYQQRGKQKVPNFVDAQLGDGHFLLHTQPAAFSNFHMLKGDHYTYAEEITSKMPVGNLYWHASHENDSPFSTGSSALSYIMSQPALKAAWYLALLGLLIFMFFNARRRQRIIPHIQPVRNTTVDFAKTIGNLYFMEGNHHTIIEKKIIYFLEHVRTEYLIDTYELNDTFIEKLQLKTGKPIEDIQKAISLIKKHRHNFASTEADVEAINNAIENLRL